MKHTTLITATLAFGLTTLGCAHKEPPISYTPSNAAIVRSISDAKRQVSALKPQVSPAGLAALSDLNSSLDRTIAEVALYSAKVDDLSTKLVSSEEQVAWEREKRMKALKEVWGWRLLALTIAGITLAAVGIKTGWRFFL